MERFYPNPAGWDGHACWSGSALTDRKECLHTHTTMFQAAVAVMAEDLSRYLKEKINQRVPITIAHTRSSFLRLFGVVGFHFVCRPGSH